MCINMRVLFDIIFVCISCIFETLVREDMWSHQLTLTPTPSCCLLCAPDEHWDLAHPIGMYQIGTSELRRDLGMFARELDISWDACG